MAYLQGHRFPHDRELTPLQRLTSELVQGVVAPAAVQNATDGHDAGLIGEMRQAR
ncbi:MAG TPA: hypothetical protein VIH63_03890 [Xanthobacteraceae bacterium]